MKAITLCVTTRGIGFGVVNVFSALFEFNNVPVRGNIYELYRVSLEVLQVKVQMVQRSVQAIQASEEDYMTLPRNEDLVIAAKGMIALPDQITAVINNVGKVKIGDKLYVPKIGRVNRTPRDRFIPQSEQIVLANLRQPY